MRDIRALGLEENVVELEMVGYTRVRPLVNPSCETNERS
jgi:hypothetical protein